MLSALTNSSHYSQQYENQLANSSILIFILSPVLPNPQSWNLLLKITDEKKFLFRTGIQIPVLKNYKT